MNLALHNALSELSGLECWSVIAGKGTGSVVSLGFGSRVPARRFSANRFLTIEERQSEPEFSLYIEAAWRLSDSEHVLATWSEAGSKGEWRDHLERLRGDILESAIAHPIGLDLELRFRGGLTFAVFCDQGPDADNYTLLTPKHAVAVTYRSHVVIEPRT